MKIIGDLETAVCENNMHFLLVLLVTYYSVDWDI